MKLFHLRHVPWIDSQLIYHAQPRVGIEGINILAPNSPYVCIGYHQNMEQEVDLDYCEEKNIPIFRREVGGGAVFLDGDQIFYHIVVHRNNSLATGSKADFFRRMLEPVAQTYRDLGIAAKYRPVNDVITEEGRKIAGTGAVEIGDYIILVGNLIADFDYATMARVLRVPDEKYRDKVFKSMKENLTTIKRELGEIPAWDDMVDPLLKNYQTVLGELEESALAVEVSEKMKDLKPLFLSEDWLFKKRRRANERTVKIASDVNIVEKIHKAPGGLIRCTYERKDGKMYGLSISGDFFSYPSEAIRNLEIHLEGASLNDLQSSVESFYNDESIDTPGITSEEWVKAFTQ